MPDRISISWLACSTSNPIIMKQILLSVVFIIFIAPVYAQKYISRSGKVSFFSATTVENIQAINNETACVLDAKNGDLAFIVPIRSFKFEKALMEEHFNENYLESDKYPKAEFKGKIANIAAVNLGSDGTYPVQVSGKMTIHGMTRDMTIPGILVVSAGTITSDAKFSVRCSDYGVKIPSVVASQIAEEIKVTVHAAMTADDR
jgi:hypothetical protein